MSMTDYNDLPEDIVAKILSFLSPRDICRSSLVSKISNSAARSDAVWDRFLPSDFIDEILRSLHCSSKKDLYFSLCDNPIPVQDSNLSLWLEKRSGKKCYFLPSCRLKFLIKSRGLGLIGNIRSPILSENTFYSISVVFSSTRVSIYSHDKTLTFHGGLMFGHGTSDNKLSNLFRFSEKSADLSNAGGGEEGWLNVAVGEFFNEGGLDEYLLIVIGIKGNLRKGDVRGIEIKSTG